jgi:CheY-like chemotaxis protein
MTVQSQVGEGTAFTIFLPATEDADKHVLECQGGNCVSVQSAKILLMDDEQVVRDVVGIQLKTLGHEAETVADGDEAVDKYRQAWQEGTPFDMVIVDLTVPAGMGGEETARYILEINEDAKIVVVSGYSNNEVMDNYLEYGFKATVIKPFGLAELSRMVKNVLG